jgi:hypothetical protein
MGERYPKLHPDSTQSARTSKSRGLSNPSVLVYTTFFSVVFRCWTCHEHGSTHGAVLALPGTQLGVHERTCTGPPRHLQNKQTPCTAAAARRGHLRA